MEELLFNFGVSGCNWNYKMKHFKVQKLEKLLGKQTHYLYHLIVPLFHAEQFILPPDVLALKLTGLTFVSLYSMWAAINTTCIFEALFKTFSFCERSLEAASVVWTYWSYFTMLHIKSLLSLVIFAAVSCMCLFTLLSLGSWQSFASTL